MVRLQAYPNRPVIIPYQSPTLRFVADSTCTTDGTGCTEQRSKDKPYFM